MRLYYRYEMAKIKIAMLAECIQITALWVIGALDRADVAWAWGELFETY
jgi:hypothetical protein